MKAAAMRYADLLEKGCFITHHEQDEIAKLLRRLAMTEDEAWDALEVKQSKAKKPPMTDKKALEIAFLALVEIDRQTPYPIAKYAIMCINEAFNNQIKE